MKFCECMGVRPFWGAMKDIADEVVEVVEAIFLERKVEKVKDEVSDVCWGFGRLIAGQKGEVYVSVKGDKRHYDKIVGRMRDQGCIRSERKVAEGKGCV